VHKGPESVSCAQSGVGIKYGIVAAGPGSGMLCSAVRPMGVTVASEVRERRMPHGNETAMPNAHSRSAGTHATTERWIDAAGRQVSSITVRAEMVRRV